MPKQIITVIGLLISLGVIALGIFLVALPLYLQSVSVDEQTQTVSQTNDAYQLQVDRLREEAERQDEIDASVAALREQIPATDSFDDVFEVIGRAAESSGVQIASITVGTSAPFVERVAPTGIGEEVAVEEPAPAETADLEGDEVGTPTPVDPTAPLSGRQQVDFTMQVSAVDMAAVTAFLDALRAGPRLLSTITANVTQTGSAIEVSVTALTFVDTEAIS